MKRKPNKKQPNNQSKKAQQIATIGNKDDWRQSYDSLEPKYQIAIDLRLDNFKYRDIAAYKGIEVDEQSVRRWFMTGGICWLAYQQKKRIRAMERDELFDDIKKKELRDLATDAIQVIRHSLRVKKDGAVAIEVLRFNGLEPPKKIADVTPESPAVREIRDFIKSQEQKYATPVKRLQNKRRATGRTKPHTV